MDAGGSSHFILFVRHEKYGIVPPIQSGSSLWNEISLESPHRHTQRYISMVIANPATLIMKIIACHSQMLLDPFVNGHGCCYGTGDNLDLHFC